MSGFRPNGIVPVNLCVDATLRNGIRRVERRWLRAEKGARKFQFVEALMFAVAFRLQARYFLRSQKRNIYGSNHFSPECRRRPARRKKSDGISGLRQSRRRNRRATVQLHAARRQALQKRADRKSTRLNSSHVSESRMP